MKSLLITLFVLAVNLTFAQQGRHELPIDTISIGGKEQEIKMTRLEGYEELLEELMIVRDSIANSSEGAVPDTLAQVPSGKDAHAGRSTSSYRHQLDALIQEMKRSEGDETLMKQGYDLLDKIRRDR